MANGNERPGDLDTATGSAFIPETSERAASQSAKRDQLSAESDDPSSAVLQSEDAISTHAQRRRAQARRYLCLDDDFKEGGCL